MRSLAARLTISAAAWIALGAAAIFVIQSEQRLATRHGGVRAFDLHARETVDALADARAAQQAYVAAGQGVAFWMPRVGALVQQTSGAVAGLREAAASAEARRVLGLAAVAITDFGSIDQRARDYIRTGESLMAGDVVFTEGAEAAANSARQVEAARLAEREALDAEEAQVRKMEATAAGGAAVFAALALALLGFAPAARETAVSIAPAPQPQEISEIVAHARPRGSAPALRAAAELCTEFGRVNDLPDLTLLLGRAANLMDASGLIVWLGSTSGADLRPVLAHGYSDTTLAKIPAVPRSADNAAAAAYRSGALQIVLTRPGTSPGAVVAPLLSPDGCIGALTAEIRDRGETSDSVQALAAIFAAQLVNMVGAAATTPAVAEHDVSKVASA
ncbi:MAG TPA: hypothetical protein VH417_15265 [Vicinamibacterales bacterium]|jgi:hypothetical protein